MQTFNYDHHFSSSESEQDYIDMEVQQGSPFATIFGHSNQEFEFQSFSSSSEKDHHATTSPADDLFYMGNLLPLHLPPRLQMLQKIFQHSYSTGFNTKMEDLEESFKTPLESTPFESCNVSPSHSCQVSGELNPREYFLECSTSLIKEKKSWTKKLMKWPNLKSLFTKSAGCAYDSRTHAANHGPAPAPQKCTDHKPFGQIKYNKEPSYGKEDYKGSSRFTHRRSFSGVFKMESKSKKSTSNSSLNSNVQVLKRSSTVMSSELENPIQAAIAHCKKSLDQQQYLILFKNEY